MWPNIRQNMPLIPALNDLRIVQHRLIFFDSDMPEKRLNYVKQSKGHLGLVHTKLWESIKHNNRHTLRLDREVVNAILSKTGPMADEISLEVALLVELGTCYAVKLCYYSIWNIVNYARYCCKI